MYVGENLAMQNDRTQHFDDSFINAASQSPGNRDSPVLVPFPPASKPFVLYGFVAVILSLFAFRETFDTGSASVGTIVYVGFLVLPVACAQYSVGITDMQIGRTLVNRQ